MQYARRVRGRSSQVGHDNKYGKVIATGRPLRRMLGWRAPAPCQSQFDIKVSLNNATLRGASTCMQT